MRKLPVQYSQLLNYVERHARGKSWEKRGLFTRQRNGSLLTFVDLTVVLLHPVYIEQSITDGVY